MGFFGFEIALRGDMEAAPRVSRGRTKLSLPDRLSDAASH